MADSEERLRFWLAVVSRHNFLLGVKSTHTELKTLD